VTVPGSPPTAEPAGIITGMNRPHRLPFVATLALMLTLGGCAAYVNIPDQKGSVARSNPNTDNVRLIEAEALTWLIGESAVSGPVGVTLPANTSAQTYDWVLGQIGPRATRGEVDRGVNYEVRGVRIRANEGEVDIAQSGSVGVARLVTVDLDYDAFGGWSVERMQPWGTIQDPSQRVYKPAGTQPAEW
jgi:hypothetical protein